MPPEGKDDRIDAEKTGTVRQAQALLDDAKIKLERAQNLVQRGVLAQATEQVYLTGDVLATAVRAGQPPWQIRTYTLDADLLHKQLDTRADVAMVWGRNHLWAAGLHADINTDRLQLTSPIYGEFAPR